METLIVIIIAVLAIVGLVVYNTFAWGYVCFKFYWWFIMPVFAGMPHLNLWQCIGLWFFISLFKNHSTSTSGKKDEDENSGIKSIISTLVSPWIILLIASFFTN